MKTWKAALVHAGLAAGQALVGIPIVSPNESPTNFVVNNFFQLFLQTGLTALHAVAAKKNSETDPKGNTLVYDFKSDAYKSEKK